MPKKKQTSTKATKVAKRGFSATKTKELFGAIYRNDRKKVKSLIQSNANPNAIYKGSSSYSPTKPIDGQTPLLWAIGLGFDGVAAELIRGGADVNGTGGRKQSKTTPIAAASSGFSLGLAKKLIKLGADIDLPIGSTKDTALHCAVNADNEFHVENLLKLGANPSLKNANGKTPKTIATAKGMTSVVGMLSKYEKKTRSTKTAKTPRKKATVASGKSKTQLRDELISAITDNKPKEVESLLKDGADPNMTFPGKSNPLLLATQHIHKGIAARLIKAGAKAKGSILMESIGDSAWTKMLVEAGADPNKAGDQQTPLERAISSDDVSVVKLLLKSGANLRNKKHPQEIELARSEGNARLVKLLEEHFKVSNKPAIKGPIAIQKAVTAAMELTGGVANALLKKPLIYVVSVNPDRFLKGAAAKRTTAREAATRIAAKKLAGKLGACVCYAFHDVNHPGIVITMPEDKFAWLRGFPKLQKWLKTCDNEIELSPSDITAWSYTFEYTPSAKIPKTTQQTWKQTFPDDDTKVKITSSLVRIKLLDDN